MWQIVLGLLQYLSPAPAIVVERNMFAYYKVPLHLLDNRTNDSSLYIVLQCPPKVNDSIPKPKDMQTCNVIDEYKEMWTEAESRPKPKSTPLYKVQPSKRLHMMPFRIVLRPLPPPLPLQLRWVRRRRPKRQNSLSNEQRRDARNVTASNSEEDTPLKYLGRRHRKQKLLKLSADHRKFKRGSRSKGYQHMYHRDENYNDHIFYDELRLDGKFDKYGKANEDY